MNLELDLDYIKTYCHCELALTYVSHQRLEPQDVWIIGSSPWDVFFLKHAAGWKTISLDSKDLRTQVDRNSVLAIECRREGLFVQ